MPVCGFGGLALGLAAARRAGPRWCRRRRLAGGQAAPSSGEGEGRDLSVHGRRAEPPRNVRSQATAEQARRADPAEGVRRGQVSVRRSATPSSSERGERSRSTARAVSRSPTCSRIPPSASTISRSFGPVTAIWSSTLRPSTNCSLAGSCPGSRAWGRGFFTASGPRASRCLRTS